MKKMISSLIIVLLILTAFTIVVLPVISEQVDSSSNPTTRGPRWSSYKAYYNKTFNMAKSWSPDNISVVAFVQTEDQTSKAKDSQGSSGNFDSSLVMQSTIDFLDGSKTSTGTSRNVLGELFTATWCQFCPGGVGAFDRITRDSNFFPTRTTMIAFHASGDHGNQAGVTRSSRYNFGGIPTAIFDGVECFTGGSTDPNSSAPESHYKRLINSRALKQSILDITTFGQKTTSNGWINVSVELLNPTPIRNLKVQIMVVEDIYPANNSGAFYRYTVQDILTTGDFNPPNHAPNVKQELQPLSIPEDGLDETSIQLGPAFEDEDLDVVTYSSDREGANKQNNKVEIDEKGNVTLTPDANWNGEEDITFYCDDGIADPVGQTIKVTIDDVNDAPTVNDPMTDFTMYEDLPVENKFNLSYVFTDIDTDPNLNAEPQAPLDYTYSGNDKIKVSIKDSFVSFDPDPDWNGEETITFTATDSDSASVSDDVKIKVTSENDAPVLAKAIPGVTMNEDEKLYDELDLNEYFFDQDGDSLTYDFEDPDNIEIKLKYIQASVYVSIIPDTNWYGAKTISFEATDIPGTTPVIGKMNITVNPVNDQPILNDTDDWEIKSKDIIAEQSTIEVDEDSSASIFVTAYDPADYDKLTFTDDTELFDINPSTGEIAFTPTNSDVGSYDVTITVNDNQAEKNIDSDTFTFIINNVNDPPETPVISAPKDGETYITDTEIDFKGSSDDPDLHIEDTDELLSYQWSVDDSTEVLSLDSEFTTKLSPGTYKIVLTVADKLGLESSASVTIMVDINRELDTDSDGTPDFQDDDDDGDDIPDDWEEKYSLDPLDASDAMKDSDNDDFTNLEEYYGDDGKPGGDDSSNPTKKFSTPEVEAESKADQGSTSSFSTIGIMAIIAIIIVVVILISLFLILSKKRKKAEGVSKEPLPISPPAPAPPTPSPTVMPPQYPQPPQPGATYYLYPPELQTPPPQPLQQIPQQPPQTSPPQQQTSPVSAQVPPPAPVLTQPQPTMAPPTVGVDSGQSGLPSGVGETPLLPSGESELEEVQKTEEAPEPEMTSEPEVADGTEEPSDAETTQKESIAESACPHCGEAVKAGWMLCPNCKQFLE